MNEIKNYRETFKCLQCRGAILEEALINVTVMSTILSIDEDGEIDYANANNEGGDVLHYLCGECGSIVKDVDDNIPSSPIELVEVLKYRVSKGMSY